MNIADEDREALLRVLVIKREHRIIDNRSGGYRCEECGAEFDWTSDEKMRAKSHEYGPVVDAILTSDVFTRIVHGAEPEWEYGVEYEMTSTESDFIPAPSRTEAEKWVTESLSDTGLIRRRKAGEWEEVDD